LGGDVDQGCSPSSPLGVGWGGVRVMRNP
jgi:hypothetical protein